MTMWKAEVTIRGRRPLLVNKGPDPRTLFGSSGVKPKTPEGIPDLEKFIQEKAEAATYKDEAGHYVLPSKNILSNILEASRGFKAETKGGRTTGVNPMMMIKGSIDIEPESPQLTDWDGNALKGYEVKLDAIPTKQKSRSRPSGRCSRSGRSAIPSNGTRPYTTSRATCFTPSWTGLVISAAATGTRASELTTSSGSRSRRYEGQAL